MAGLVMCRKCSLTIGVGSKPYGPQIWYAYVTRADGFGTMTADCTNGGIHEALLDDIPAIEAWLGS